MVKGRDSGLPLVYGKVKLKIPVMGRNLELRDVRAQVDNRLTEMKCEMTEEKREKATQELWRKWKESQKFEPGHHWERCRPLASKTQNGAGNSQDSVLEVPPVPFFSSEA